MKVQRKSVRFVKIVAAMVAVGFATGCGTASGDLGGGLASSAGALGAVSRPSNLAPAKAAVVPPLPRINPLRGRTPPDGVGTYVPYDQAMKDRFDWAFEGIDLKTGN